MAQKIRTGEGVLRVIPPPGHPATFVFSTLRLVKLTNLIHQTTQRRGEEYSHLIGPTVLQQRSSSRYAFPSKKNTVPVPE